MDSPIWVGIDPGLSPTVAVMKNGKVTFRVAHNIFKFDKGYELTDADKWRRIASIYGSVAKILTSFEGQKVVGLERVSFAEKFRVAEMAKIEHVLIGLLLNRGDITTFYILAPTTIKKLASGKGNATKKEVREFLGKQYPAILRTNNLNISDSLAIMLSAKVTYEQKNKKP